MTVPSTTRRAGPFLGTGAQVAFPFTFRVFAASDIRVALADADGIETTQLLTTDYTVSINADQDTAPGGTVTMLAAPAVGETLVIVGATPYDQTLDLPSAGNYSPRALENALDRIVFQVQQLAEATGRSLTLPATAAGASTALPAPEAGKVIGWDAAARGLRNIDPATLASIVAYSSRRTLVANGGAASYTLAADPGGASNTLVAVSGVVQTPGVDYTVSGTTLTPTTAWPAGTGNVVVVYGEALPVGTADAQDVAFFPGGTGAAQRSVQDKLRDTLNARDYGATGSGSNETAAVQLAINALPAGGGEVTVPAGVKFNLKSLTFPARCNLRYRVDDDLSSPGQGSDIGSGELVYFSANSSYPADPTGGAVNEWRFTAPFHPGIIVDVRKDVTGANSGLAPGQSLTEPVRGSWNILDEQTDAFRVVYEHYASGSNFSMVKIHAWRRVVVLNGIGTSQWASVPAEGTVITGTTSGAKGFVLSVAAGSTTVLWFSGRFVAGETVSDNNETTTATITSAVFSLTAMSPLSQGLKRGNWAVGLPADAVRDMFTVGGKIASQRTRGTFYEDESILHPGFVWVDSYENPTPNGFEAIYDTSGAAASRRITLRKYNSTIDIGHIGAVAAHVSVNDPGGTPILRAGSFNVANVVRGGSVGRYDFTFANALPTANYRLMLSSQFTGHLTFDLKATTGFSVFAFNAAGVAQWAPFDFDVVVVGGDI